MKFATIEGRLRDLERSGGYVSLPDGSRFKPIHCGIELYVSLMKLHNDLGREPLLSDLSPEDREKWLCYSKWQPGPEEGALAHRLVEMGRELVEKS